MIAGLWSLGAVAEASTSISSVDQCPPKVQLNDKKFFSRKMQPLLDERCVMCHMTGAENGGLNLEAKVAVSNLVNQPSTETSDLKRVMAGSPNQSYLMRKLDGTHIDAGGQGDRMPLNNAPLNEDEMARITAWICALPKPAR